MEPLDILLLVLVATAVWAVVELALTIRKARTTLDEVSHSATDAMDQATPIIAKLDGVVDDLQPALREVTPLVEKVTVTVDQANTSLGSVNAILGDVSSATHGVAEVGESASRIVNTATDAAVGVVSKVASLGGINIPEGQSLIARRSEAAAPQFEAASSDDPTSAPAAEPDDEPVSKGGYVTYAPVASDDQSAE